jgi:hypothetical protein
MEVHTFARFEKDQLYFADFAGRCSACRSILSRLISIYLAHPVLKRVQHVRAEMSAGSIIVFESTWQTTIVSIDTHHRQPPRSNFSA